MVDVYEEKERSEMADAQRDDLRARIDALEAENKTLKAQVEYERAWKETNAAQAEKLTETVESLSARLAEAEEKLATEQAEHTREVLLHAVTKHKLDEASELNSQCPAMLDAANARADAEKERADRAERAYEGAALQLCKDWQERKDYLFDTEQRAEKAEAKAARLRGALQKVEAYLSSEESPLHTLWENGAICAYDETPCESWREVLAQLRDFKIPADCLGYGAEWPAVTIYREIYAAALQEKENTGELQ